MRKTTRTWTVSAGAALIAAALTVTAAPSQAASADRSGTTAGRVAKPAKPAKPVKPVKPRAPKPPQAKGGKGKPTSPPFVAPTTFEYVRSDCRREDEGTFRVVHYWQVSGGVYTYFRNGVGKPVNVYSGEPQTVSWKVAVSDPAWIPEDGPLPAPTEALAQGSLVVAPIGRPSQWQRIALPEQTVALDCAE